MTKRSPLLLLLGATLAGCEAREDPVEDPPWPGNVIADVDDLTGIRTGLFRTYGPTSPLIGGQDTIHVQVGYYCNVDDTAEPGIVSDGLFLKIILPDTSLTDDTSEAFEQLTGTMGLLDVARMSVDGSVAAWKYRPSPDIGAWYLDGEMGFAPPEGVKLPAERNAFLRKHIGAYEGLRGSPVFHSGMATLAQIESDLRDVWPSFADYVASRYLDSDTVAIELKRVLQFDMEGFSRAVDEIRYWCPIDESRSAWAEVRHRHFAVLDSIRTDIQNARLAAEQRQAARERMQFITDSIRIAEEQLVRRLMSASRLHAERFVEWTDANGFRLEDASDLEKACYSPVAGLTRPRWLTTECAEWSRVRKIGNSH